MSIEVRTTIRGERRYKARLRDPAGREYAKTFRTRKAAEKFAATEHADKARGSWLDPRGGDIPFRQWAEEWLRSNPTKSESSYARDESIIRLHLNPYIGNDRIGATTNVRIQRIVNAWCKKAKPRTVRRQYDTLRAIFSAAVEAELIGRSPCRKIHLPEPAPVKRSVIDGNELELLSFTLGPRYALMAYLAAELGLRWGEVAGNRACDYDFEEERITVFEQRTRGTSGRMLTRPPKSNAGRRSIAASASLMKVARAHLEFAGIRDLDSPALLFVDRNGDGLSYSNWYHRIWVPATIAIGRPGLQFHDLRRTSATALVQAGVDIKTAQERLGHSDPRLTIGLYAQVTKAGERNAADRLGEHFRPARSV